MNYSLIDEGVMMKKLMIVLGLLILLFLFCGTGNNIVTILQAQNSSEIFVDSTFEISATMRVTGSVSGIGVHINYDTTVISVDSIYNLPGLFEDELVKLYQNKQGKLIIGFWQDCESAIQDTTIILFTLKCHIKLTAKQGKTLVWCDNKDADLCDQTIIFKHNDLELFVKKLNEILMELKLE